MLPGELPDRRHLHPLGGLSLLNEAAKSAGDLGDQRGIGLIFQFQHL